MRLIPAIVLLALASYVTFAGTTRMRLSISQGKGDEKTITRENMIRIRQFILKGGKRETYCNLFNNNPAYHTKNYRYYLNPELDPKKSGFHSLTIRRPGAKRHQYLDLAFRDKHYVEVSVRDPANDLTVKGLRKLAEDAVKEILAEIEKKKKGL